MLTVECLEKALEHLIRFFFIEVALNQSLCPAVACKVGEEVGKLVLRHAFHRLSLLDCRNFYFSQNRRSKVASISRHIEQLAFQVSEKEVFERAKFFVRRSKIDELGDDDLKQLVDFVIHAFEPNLEPVCHRRKLAMDRGNASSINFLLLLLLSDIWAFYMIKKDI